MLTRLIAMLLLFSFGFSAMGECCLVSDGGIFESSSQQDTCCSAEHASSDADDQQPITEDCDDACSACLHTAMTPASQVSIGSVSHTFQYFARESTNLLSRTASIDRPPCWTT